MKTLVNSPLGGVGRDGPGFKLRHVPPHNGAASVLSTPDGEKQPKFRYNASFTTKRAGYYRPFFLVYCFLNRAY